MNDKAPEKREELELDLGRLFKSLLHKSWLIALVAVLCAVAMFFYATYFITPQYESSTMLYVNNADISVGSSLKVSYADLTASQGLVKSYIEILNTRTTLLDIIDYAGVDRTYGELRGMISAAAVEGTEIFRVTVTSTDPQEAEQIANAVGHILPKRISSIIDGTSAEIVDTAIVPTAPSAPNVSNYVMLGFLLGFALTAAIVVLHVIFDTTIRTEEDIKRMCSYPILSSVPDVSTSAKERRYYYSHAYQPEKQKNAVRNADKAARSIIGDDIPFAVAEAYKLLRTKVQFSFADDRTSHVIGVSSALSGEGKSVSSINLAFSLAQLDKKVLLVECDLRRPSVSGKLPVAKLPGLSNYLTQQYASSEVIQVCQQKNGSPIHVITAGRIPPNPIELLNSPKMQKALDNFRMVYDYIILDLPPVMEVSDALVTAKYVDGMLLVVRQNYCDRVALNTTVHQFESVEAHLLGLVINCSVEETHKLPKNYSSAYSKYNKYGKYVGAYAGNRAYKRRMEEQSAEQTQNQDEQGSGNDTP